MKQSVLGLACAVAAFTNSIGCSQIAPSRETLHGPIFALSWAPVPDEVEHITQMIWIRPNTTPEEAAKQSRSRPPGRAAAFIWLTDREIAHQDLDKVQRPDGSRTDLHGPWFDHGIQRVRGMMNRYFGAFKRHGGRLDYLILDFEIGRGIWHYDDDERVESLRAILDDPRGEALRKQLAELGVDPDPSKIANFRPWRPKNQFDQKALCNELKENMPPYVAWNYITSERTKAALNAGIFAPVKSHFPEVQGSNYNYSVVTCENLVPDLNGHAHIRDSHFGTHNSRSYYGRIGTLARDRLPGGKRYGNDPFDVLRWEVNYHRGIQRSSSIPFHAWVSSQAYYRNDYYEELIYHLALCDTDAFIYWHPERDNLPKSEHEAQARLLEKYLDALNQRFGDNSRHSVTLENIDWDSDLIVSGMCIDNTRTLWRITVPEGTQSVQITLDGDTIVRDVPAGELGIWHAAGSHQAPSFTAVDS